MKKILFSFLLLSSLCFAKVPQRAVSAAHFSTEILLSIGAEKQMVGTAYPDNEILPSLKEKYDKIPVLSMKNPTKEQFYAVKPDFLTGWDSTVLDKNLGPIKELEKNNYYYLFDIIDRKQIEMGIEYQIIVVSNCVISAKEAKKYLRINDNEKIVSIYPVGEVK